MIAPTATSVHFFDEYYQEKATALAKELQLPLNQEANIILMVGEKGLSLILKGSNPIQVDFESLTVKKRVKEGRSQGLVRACKPSTSQVIVDATAGWGRDAAVLAHFGAKLILLERQPIMAALLQDGLVRHQQHKKLDLSLVAQDARLFLTGLAPEDYPDVVYIDPMHPERQKSALVKKEMQALQTLFGPDQDSMALISLARTKIKDRVVVKWPERVPPLIEPNYSLHGKTIRFDIYLKEAPK